MAKTHARHASTPDNFCTRTVRTYSPKSEHRSSQELLARPISDISMAEPHLGFPFLGYSDKSGILAFSNRQQAGSEYDPTLQESDLVHVRVVPGRILRFQACLWPVGPRENPSSHPNEVLVAPLTSSGPGRWVLYISGRAVR